MGFFRSKLIKTSKLTTGSVSMSSRAVGTPEVLCTAHKINQPICFYVIDLKHRSKLNMVILNCTVILARYTARYDLES